MMSRNDAVTDLRDAVLEALHNSGALDKATATLRNEVFQALNDPNVAPPTPPVETIVINELIREYLKFHSLHNSLAVFEAEVGHSDETTLSRHALANELGVQDVGYVQKAPLLYTLTAPQK